MKTKFFIITRNLETKWSDSLSDSSCCQVSGSDRRQSVGRASVHPLPHQPTNYSIQWIVNSIHPHPQATYTGVGNIFFPPSLPATDQLFYWQFLEIFWSWGDFCCDFKQTMLTLGKDNGSACLHILCAFRSKLVHYVHSSRKLHIHYVQIRPTKDNMQTF